MPLYAKNLLRMIVLPKIYVRMPAQPLNHVLNQYAHHLILLHLKSVQELLSAQNPSHAHHHLKRFAPNVHLFLSLHPVQDLLHHLHVLNQLAPHVLNPRNRENVLSLKDVHLPKIAPSGRFLVPEPTPSRKHTPRGGFKHADSRQFPKMSPGWSQRARFLVPEATPAKKNTRRRGSKHAIYDNGFERCAQDGSKGHVS